MQKSYSRLLISRDIEQQIRVGSNYSKGSHSGRDDRFQSNGQAREPNQTFTADIKQIL